MCDIISYESFLNYRRVKKLAKRVCPDYPIRTEQYLGATVDWTHADLTDDALSS